MKDEKLDYFKNKILKHLIGLEKNKEDLKKSLLEAESIAKGGKGLPVGTIREWKGKKYIKISPGKWRPKYDSNSRGAKLSIAALKRKADKCTSSEELLQLILENRDRFSDDSGRPLPFVKELSDYVSALNDKYAASDKEESRFTDSELKKRIQSGKKIIAEFFKDRWNDASYIKAGRDRLMDIWAAGEAKRYEAVNTKTDMFKKLSASEKKKAREFNEKLKHELEIEAAKVFEEYKKKENKKKRNDSLESNVSGIDKIRKHYESFKSVMGNKKTVTLPNGNKIKCHYKLVEADAPTASHNEINYAPTQGFPRNANGQNINDRDYQNDADAQESVRRIAGSFNSLALESPPIVTKDGIVVSGNNRTMSSKLAARNGTDKAYLQDLKELLDEYGLEESDLKGFKNPRLILEVDEEHKGDYTTEEFAQFNRDTKKTMSNVEKAVKLTKTLNEQKISSIASELTNYDTMGELYADSKGCQQFVGKLIEAGIIGDNEKAQYCKSDGTLNDTGKDFVETVLVGSVLDEGNIRKLDSVGGKRIRQKLVRSILPLIENKGNGKEYSFNKELNRAVDIAVTVSKSHDTWKTVDDYLAQGSLFGDEKPDEVTSKLAKLIHDEGEKAFAQRMRDLDAGLRDSANGMCDIFLGGVESKQSLMERFLDIKKSIQDIVTNILRKERTAKELVVEVLADIA
ncbi:hypothetical protein [Treponema socranskii]|uniref:hypothetical protein n=1 Tax=Treponema socranskii TaxID=53419 RepID=UPI003D8C5E34